MVIIVYDGERLSSNWGLVSVHLVTDQLIVTNHSVHCGYLLIHWGMGGMYVSETYNVHLYHDHKSFVSTMHLKNLAISHHSSHNYKIITHVC